jgi:DNA-binding transcriptional LysR family regulator
MDTILNMKAFVATARGGSFSEAARQLSVAPSVISKRVNQLEWQLRSRLLERTTRRVRLTEIGEQYLPTIRSIISEYDDLAAGMLRSPGELEGHIRVKSPAALTSLHLGKVFTAFQRTNPRVTLEIVLIDRSVNPIEEGFDVVLGLLPASFDGVVEEALLSYPRVACASPDYLKHHGHPKHPRDLTNHDCLVFQPAGSTWTFQSRRGPISVQVRPKFSSNDIQLIVDAAADGSGIAVLSKLIAKQSIRDGLLVPILEDFPLPDHWLKAFVPRSRVGLARVQALLTAIRGSFAPTPPWEQP